jgi:hypothetical protein
MLRAAENKNLVEVLGTRDKGVRRWTRPLVMARPYYETLDHPLPFLNDGKCAASVIRITP